MERPYWINDFATAVEIYDKTVNLSGWDINGFPQLSKLEFILEMSDYEVDHREQFIDFISLIHNWNIRTISEKRNH